MSISHGPPAAGITIELEHKDAAAIAEALKTFAELDQGDNSDYDELLRLAGLISKTVVSPVQLVLAALPVGPTTLDYVEAADGALRAGMVEYYSDNKDLRFIAALLDECGPDPVDSDQRALAAWLVHQLTAAV